jgi:hypothetical protein
MATSPRPKMTFLYRERATMRTIGDLLQAGDEAAT